MGTKSGSGSEDVFEVVLVMYLEGKYIIIYPPYDFDDVFEYSIVNLNYNIK